MPRTTMAEKRQVARSFSDPNRPLFKIAKLMNGYEDARTQGETLLARSKATGRARVARHVGFLRGKEGTE